MVSNSRAPTAVTPVAAVLPASETATPSEATSAEPTAASESISLQPATDYDEILEGTGRAIADGSAWVWYLGGGVAVPLDGHFAAGELDTVEGIEHRSKPIIAVHFHPEASPGPYDCMYVFDRFKEVITSGVKPEAAAKAPRAKKKAKKPAKKKKKGVRKGAKR